MSENTLIQGKCVSLKERRICFAHGYDIFSKFLGGGAVGRVFLGRARPEKIKENDKLTLVSLDNQPLLVAIKIIYADGGADFVGILAKYLPREITNMGKAFGHPNIVQLLDVFVSCKRVFLVMEFASNGNLDELYAQVIADTTRSYMEEDEARYYYREILSGLEHLHSHRIAHRESTTSNLDKCRAFIAVSANLSGRDLKLENILLGDDGRVKLCDLGFSTTSLGRGSDTESVGEAARSVGSMTLVGTPEFMAPELSGTSSAYNALRADMWSIGVVLFVLVNGYFPDVEGMSENSKNVNDQEDSLIFRKNLSEECKSLLRRVLQLSPDLRPTAQELISSSWLKGPCKKPVPVKNIVLQEKQLNMIKQKKIYEFQAQYVRSYLFQRNLLLKSTRAKILDDKQLPIQLLSEFGIRIMLPRQDTRGKVVAEIWRLDAILRKDNNNKSTYIKADGCDPCCGLNIPCEWAAEDAKSTIGIPRVKRIVQNLSMIDHWLRIRNENEAPITEMEKCVQLYNTVDLDFDEGWSLEEEVPRPDYEWVSDSLEPTSYEDVDAPSRLRFSSLKLAPVSTALSVVDILVWRIPSSMPEAGIEADCLEGDAQLLTTKKVPEFSNNMTFVLPGTSIDVRKEDASGKPWTEDDQINSTTKDESLSTSFTATRIVKRKRSALSKSQAKIQKKTTDVEAGKPLDISVSESMVGTSTSSMSNAQFPAPGSLADHDVAMGAPGCEVTPQVKRTNQVVSSSSGESSLRSQQQRRKRKILRVKRGAIPKQRKDAALIPKPEAGDTYADSTNEAPRRLSGIGQLMVKGPSGTNKGMKLRKRKFGGKLAQCNSDCNEKMFPTAAVAADVQFQELVCEEGAAKRENTSEASPKQFEDKPDLEIASVIPAHGVIAEPLDIPELLISNPTAVRKERDENEGNAGKQGNSSTVILTQERLSFDFFQRTDNPSIANGQQHKTSKISEESVVSMLTGPDAEQQDREKLNLTNLSQSNDFFFNKNDLCRLFQAAQRDFERRIEMLQKQCFQLLSSQEIFRDNIDPILQFGQQQLHECSAAEHLKDLRNAKLFFKKKSLGTCEAPSPSDDADLRFVDNPVFSLQKGNTQGDEEHATPLELLDNPGRGDALKNATSFIPKIPNEVPFVKILENRRVDEEDCLAQTAANEMAETEQKCDSISPIAFIQAKDVSTQTCDMAVQRIPDAHGKVDVSTQTSVDVKEQASATDGQSSTSAATSQLSEFKPLPGLSTCVSTEAEKESSLFISLDDISLQVADNGSVSFGGSLSAAFTRAEDSDLSQNSVENLAEATRNHENEKNNETRGLPRQKKNSMFRFFSWLAGKCSRRRRRKSSRRGECLNAV